MHERAVRVVHIERTARAGLLPVRTEHEVVDNQLAFAVEKVRERHLPVRPVEKVIFPDFDPEKLAAVAGSARITTANSRADSSERFFEGDKLFTFFQRRHDISEHDEA
jgi:hypothetical protein